MDPDAAGGLRLTLAAAAAFVLIVPFGLALLAVATRWGPLQRLDVRLDNRVNELVGAHPDVVRTAKLLSAVFAPSMFDVVAVLAALALLVARSPRRAAWLALTVLASDLLDSAVKAAVRRARPTVPDPVEVLHSYSFPSGHAMGVVVGVGALLVAVLPLLPRAFTAPLVALGLLVIVLVGASRVVLGVHYASDVLAGWLLGSAWLAATTAGFRAWQHELPARVRRSTQDAR